ncbi:MAG: hypothetical protein JXD19_06115 [Deltaproteobacteria bacterium]|nr:hypothetical protein [Deltaproteobacteria bacterium]
MAKPTIHKGHEEHLCYLHNIGFLEKNVEAYKKLLHVSNYMCKKCGRTAANKENLCKPVKLKSMIKKGSQEYK